jgi:putative redox protein
MTSIHWLYGSDLRCTAQHGPLRDHARDRCPHRQPGQGRALLPSDLVATSLASCILTVMGIVANPHGHPVGAGFEPEP